VDRVAVVRQGVRHETIVAGIAHRRVQEAIDNERASSLIEFVFNGFAADRHFHNDVHVLRWIGADRDGIDAHGLSFVRASRRTASVDLLLPRGITDSYEASSGWASHCYRGAHSQRQV